MTDCRVLPYPTLSSALLPSAPFLFPSPLLCVLPFHQLVLQEGGGGERERERRVPSAQGQGPDGRRHSSSHLHSAPGPLRSQLHAGVQVFIPAKAQPLNNITISAQLFQQKLPSDIVPCSHPYPSLPKPN